MVRDIFTSHHVTFVENQKWILIKNANDLLINKIFPLKENLGLLD